MNITDIFFNNGQLNWDAISTICNIGLVAALVWITACYAREVKRQTAIMVRDSERNKILEQVQDVLTPTIHFLKSEIEAIQDNKIFWYRDRSGEGRFDRRLSKLFYDNKKERSATLRDVFKKILGLETKFHTPNVLYDKLNEFYAKIECEVKTPKLTERLKVLVSNFNESREEAYRLRAEAFDEPERIFGEYIINLRCPIERSPDTIEPRIDFWEENRDELLKFRDTPQIKELDKEIEGVLSQLRKLDEALLEKIEAIREEYRLKYNFTKYEIDPKLREVEEWLK
jgi:phage host-nuclease inhibitor protein Gam